MSVEMKDSRIPWVGTIPTTWDVVQLSSIFKEHKDKNKLLEENNLLSLSYGRIIRKDISTKEGLLPQSFDGYNIIQKGDIVFRLTDLQNDKRSLRTGLCKEKGIITSAYITIRKTQELHSEFFHYLLHSYDECKVFYGLGDGVRQGMTFDDLRKLLLVVPPFQLQQQIATFLDEKCADIDQLIALQQKMIDELKAYKQSVITEAVCKGLDKSVPMKNSGIEWIGEVPEGWEICRIKNILESGKSSMRTGPFGSELKGNDFTDEGYWVYNQRTVLDENYITNNTFVKEEKFVDMKAFAVQENDILLTTRGSIGKISRIPKQFHEGIIHPCIIKFRISNIVVNYFLLKYIFNESDFVLSQLKYFSNSTTIDVVYTDKLKSVYIPLGSIEEQKNIVSYLDQKSSQIDTLISIKQQKIDELKDYKKSMIYEYITGKKQVPENNIRPLSNCEAVECD